MINPFKHRWVRVTAWIFVSLVTLYLLLWAALNWTGARMLRAAEARIKAAGESVELRDILPDPVNDEQNFCAIPVLKDLALVIDGDAAKGEPAAKRERLKSLGFWMSDPTRHRGRKSVLEPKGAKTGMRCDLAAWRDYFRRVGRLPDAPKPGDPAREVLEALSTQDAVVAELAAGLERPVAQWTPACKERLSMVATADLSRPHFGTVVSLCRALSLRAAAAAQAGDAKKAHEALRILIKVYEATAHETTLTGWLVSTAMTASVASAAWELCDARLGTADDFARLEEAFCRLDHRAAALQTWRSELAFGLLFWQQGKNTGDMRWVNPDDPPSQMIGRWVPDGLYDGKSAVAAESKLNAAILPLRDHGWVAALSAVESREVELANAPKGWLACLQPFQERVFGEVPAISLFRRAIYAQCLIDQAAVACVLERHRIETGGYPETLDRLKLASGRPLPLDVISGKPMGYRTTANGRYALWCVGLDREDDGGKRHHEPMGDPAEKGWKGDWLWTYPTGT
jgi:hypothetical protein